MPASHELPGPIFCDLSARTKLRLAGSDRLRFLNGQITNDAAKSTTALAVGGAVLSARGKMDAYLFLSQDADSFYLDADPELRDRLLPRLDRYVIADDVTIEDVSGQFSIFHVLGETPPEPSARQRTVKVNRFRQAGWDVWVEMPRHDEVFNKLASSFTFCDDASLEVFRVEQGIPRWARELTEEIIPVEAGLEESSIDYEKGCYIGQEVISRMKMSGQRNKKLSGFMSLYESPLEAGMKIFPVGERARQVGWITSAVHSKRLGREIALGYLKRPFYQAGYRLDALDPEDQTGAGVRIEIADLPMSAAQRESD